MAGGKGKKGPTKGSGGKGKRALEGKKNIQPAHQRHWYEERQRARAAKREEKFKEKPRREAPAAARPHRSGGGPELLVGRNPVVEALRAHVPATRLYVSNSLDEDERVTEAMKLAARAEVELREVPRAELDRRCDSAGQPGATHQGVALQVRPYHYSSAEELLERSQDFDQPPLLVALDGVTDPQNLGAVARSAAAFGAHGLLIPERRAAGVTAAAWKASAGTLAYLPVAQETNLTRTLAAYKKAGLFAVGLDSAGDTRLDHLTLATDPLVLVVGSEGKGLSRLVRESCDMVAGVPISGAESLNASVALGVALYEVARRRMSEA